MLSPDQSLSLQCCTASFVPSPVKTGSSGSCLPWSQSYQRTAQTSCWTAQNICSWPPTFPAYYTTCLKQSCPCTGHSLIFPQRPPSQVPTFPCRQIFQILGDGCLPTALLLSYRAGIQVRCDHLEYPQPEDSCLYSDG